VLEPSWKPLIEAKKEEGGGVHQLETPESSVHRAPVTSSLGSLVRLDGRSPLSPIRSRAPSLRVEIRMSRR
jgi:hypothetical protein